MLNIHLIRLILAITTFDKTLYQNSSSEGNLSEYFVTRLTVPVKTWLNVKLVGVRQNMNLPTMVNCIMGNDRAEETVYISLSTLARLVTRHATLSNPFVLTRLLLMRLYRCRQEGIRLFSYALCTSDVTRGTLIQRTVQEDLDNGGQC